MNCYGDFIATGMIVLIVAVFNILISRAAYLLGLDPTGTNFIFENLPLCVGLYFLFIFIILLFMVARLCVGATKVKAQVTCLRVCLILIAVASVIISQTVRKPGYVYLTHGFLKTMRSKADIGAIRTF